MTTTQSNPYLADPPMAQLTGSEKKVAWATDIRRGKVDDVEATLIDRAEWLARCVADGSKSPADAERILAKYQGWRDAAYARTDAKFWIDYRTFFGLDLLKRAAGA